MYVKVEPTGCCERKGMVQVRFCFFLDPTDYGYEKHHVKIDGEWQDNPFHNHFIYVEPDTIDKEIAEIGKAFLAEAYIKWATDSKLDLVNDALPFKKPAVVTESRITECDVRAESIKAITAEVKV